MNLPVRERLEEKTKQNKTNSIALKARRNTATTGSSRGNKSSTILMAGRKLTPLEQARGNKKTPWLTRSQREITTQRGRHEATPSRRKPCSQGRGFGGEKTQERERERGFSPANLLLQI
jgi:hypothetical protein